MNKKFIIISLISAFMVLGCDKRIENKETQKESGLDVVKKNNLTDEEINQLHLIADDVNASTSTLKLAQIYLNDPNAYKTEEIKAFIADYFTEQVNLEQESNSINLEYSIDQYNLSTGYSVIPQYTLKVLSLSDGVQIDSVEVNRGNCEIAAKGNKSILNYGESAKFFLRCDPWSVREVKVYLADGRSMTMTPNE